MYTAKRDPQVITSTASSGIRNQIRLPCSLTNNRFTTLIGGITLLHEVDGGDTIITIVLNLLVLIQNKLNEDLKDSNYLKTKYYEETWKVKLQL